MDVFVADSLATEMDYHHTAVVAADLDESISLYANAAG